MIRNWGEVLATQNLPRDRAMDGVSRWLLITRAGVFPTTLTAGAIGGLLAVGLPGGDAHWGYLALTLVGLLAAHAANNMVNDYFDLEAGIAAESYARTRHAPHPVLSGLISKRGLIIAIAVVLFCDLGILLLLTDARGWPIAGFALAGLFVSVGYAAPPLELEKRGLGEPGAALLWGPLMIGGTCYATSGALPPWVIVASLPWAMLVATALIGKHVDELEADREADVQTLPVILGAEKSLFLGQQLMVAFFVFVLSLVGVGRLGVWTLLVFGAAPRLWQVLRVYGRPKPDIVPPDHPLWPLWYASWAFSLMRLAGGLFVLGLLLDLIYPIRIG